jgi:hypothetical protein
MNSLFNTLPRLDVEPSACLGKLLMRERPEFAATSDVRFLTIIV